MKEIDDIIHSPARLQIVRLLVDNGEMEFSSIRQRIGISAGNLSTQIAVLNKAKYIKVHKGYRDNYPLTTIKLTDRGKEAWKEYKKVIAEYIK